MADLTVTPANVRPFGEIHRGTAGGTITAGQTLRRNTSGQFVVSSDDSAVNAATAGIALNGASANQPVDYQNGGLIDMGATVAIGKVYVQSTSGGVAPVDDIAGGEFVTILGVGTAANRLKIGIVQSGVAAAGAVV
jgi:hypothetical protein